METGMIRRVDELGRVVIPKEIRKTFRIKEGEPLEIYTEKECLILKKYSPVESVENFAECIGESLSEITGKPVVICDRDKVVYISGKNKDDVGSSLLAETERAISDRKTITRSRVDGDIPQAYKGEETFEIMNRVIVPIISGGDAYGAVLLNDKSKEGALNVQEIKLTQLSALTLAKRFE